MNALKICHWQLSHCLTFIPMVKTLTCKRSLLFYPSQTSDFNGTALLGKDLQNWCHIGCSLAGGDLNEWSLTVQKYTQSHCFPS